MASKIPYIVQPGCITKVLAKVQSAKTPDRFTADFLSTKLGFKGGNYRQFISLAKKLGLLNSDGTPTDLYKKFRNRKESGVAMAVAIRHGYHELFERNEHADALNREEFRGLIVEVTGLEEKDRKVQLMCQTFEKLKEAADFDSDLDSDALLDASTNLREPAPGEATANGTLPGLDVGSLGVGLSYNINLVLPKTDDPAVFNAIFRALREHLLRK